MGRRARRRARSAAAAAVPDLRCTGGDARPALRRVLPDVTLHHRRRAASAAACPSQARPKAGRDGTCARAAVPPRRASAGRARRCATTGQGRQLILPFKHADRPELAAVLAPHMARAGAALLRAAELLVPVPLHRRRLFSPALQPGGAAGPARSGSRAGRPVLPDALLRRRATASLGEQVGGGAGGRTVARRVRRARLARRRGSRGRHVLLIDDVHDLRRHRERLRRGAAGRRSARGGRAGRGTGAGPAPGMKPALHTMIC